MAILMRSLGDDCEGDVYDAEECVRWRKASVAVSEISTRRDSESACTDLDSNPGSVLEEETAGWSKSRMVALCSELLHGFRQPSFQSKLKGLLEQTSSSGFVPGRMELALTVQCAVLPKYGLSSSWEGVLEMMEILALFLPDPDVAELASNIDLALGMPEGHSADVAREANVRSH